MSGRAIYLDASAVVRLIRIEAETAALRTYLERERQREAVLVSSMLLRTEAVRVASLISQRYVALARHLIRREIAFVAVDREVLDQAAGLQPPRLRSLDAVHVATALSLGDDLAEFVTYDRRMVEAARHQGLPVASPS
jgi:predicted nucleic acid-binding protein